MEIKSINHKGLKVAIGAIFTIATIGIISLLWVGNQYTKPLKEFLKDGN